MSVTTRLFAEPHGTVPDVRGIAFVHIVDNAQCRTPWPESICRCGYHVLQWAITPEDVAQARDETLS